MGVKEYSRGAARAAAAEVDRIVSFDASTGEFPDVAVPSQHSIARVSNDGTTLTTVAIEGDGLDFPTSLAFGTGSGDRETVFVVNFALAPAFGCPAGSGGPALVALDAEVPGQPLP